MTQPTPYHRTHQFPDDPDVETEFDAVENTLEETLDNLELLQRDDGRLRDEVVEPHALSPLTLALLASAYEPRGAWVTATSYAARDAVTQGGSLYLCAVAHAAGTFATDLAAGKWLLVGTTAAVSSVFGRSGAVVAAAGDYDASQIDNVSIVAGATVGDALNTLDTEKLAVANNLSDLASAAAARGYLGLGAIATNTFSGGPIATAINRAISETEGCSVVICTAGVTISTPDSATWLGPFFFWIKNTSAAVVTFDPYDTETVDGALTFTVQPGETVGFMQISGGGWYSFGRTPPAGSIIQVQETSYASYSGAIATTIPLDDTIPQVSEGTQVLSLSITPRGTANKLRVRALVACQTGTNGAQAILALFRDGATNAVAAVSAGPATVVTAVPVELEYIVAAGALTSTTFTIRVGASSGSLYVNGSSAARRFGGVMVSRLTIEEIKV